MQVICNPLLADVDTGLDTIGCDDGTDSSGNLMTGLACEIVSSSGKAVISGPLVAENNENAHCQGNLILELVHFLTELNFASLNSIVYIVL